MKKMVCVFSCFLLAIGLSACSIPMPSPNESPNQAVVGQYQTVSVLLTQTSQVALIKTPQPTRITDFSPSQPVPTRTYTPVNSSVLPTATRTGAPPGTCNQAKAGLPIDVTIPDDTRVRPGEYFSKTWRLINAGSCTWDGEYAVVWFSGDDLGVARAQSFNSIVLPGQSVDVTVDMQAPKTPGTYQSNWKLHSSQGVMFGIGPGGSAPFWVRIVVVPVNTETPTPTALAPTATPLPEVYSSGALDLQLDTGIDLDSGDTNQIVNDDLRLELANSGEAILSPENGARIFSYGLSAPEFSDCTTQPLNTTPVSLDTVQPGAYLCFRTTEGLPGWVVVTAVDHEQQLMTLEFVTWAVP